MAETEQSKPWLEIVEMSRRSYVAWFDEDDGEGARVGQESLLSFDQLKAELEECRGVRDEEGLSMFEYFSVEIAAKNWHAKNMRDDVHPEGSGYEFDESKTCKKFLAAMKAALKAAQSEYDSNVPWPEWAKQAEAAGWKPPKGWKP
jgi:hypothetical protein